MAFQFDSITALSPEAESLQRGFTELRQKMDAEARCVPEDRENLMPEKEEWCRRWTRVTSDIGAIMAAGREKGVILALTADEISKGKEMGEVHGLFVEQMRALKEEAARQAEIRVVQKPSADVVMRPADEDGEDEIEPTSRPARLRRGKKPEPKATKETEDSEDDEEDKVTHEEPCARCEKMDRDCVGVEGQGCDGCKIAKVACKYSRQVRAKAKAKATSVTSSVRRPAPGPSGRVASSRGSEAPIIVSDDEESAPVRRAPKPKPKPVVVVPGRKRKLADMEGEVALADSGLRGDDLEMAGKLRGLYAKVSTIQGLLAEVSNELDMMRAHYNKKARA